MNVISMDKTYRTRDGREVRIYAVDGAGCWPVHGAYDVADGVWESTTWEASGRKLSAEIIEPLDLIEVRPTITHTYWLVHTKIGNANYWCQDPKDCLRGNSAVVGITGPHTVEFTEGEGL